MFFFIETKIKLKFLEKGLNYCKEKYIFRTRGIHVVYARFIISKKSITTRFITCGIHLPCI